MGNIISWLAAFFVRLPRIPPADPSYRQEEGTVGLAFIITNCYTGEKYLPRTEHETKWKETLKKLKFDVRPLTNASKKETMTFLRAVSEIPVDGTNCQYVVFVFSGHGGEGVLYSHNSEKMNMEKDILPFFFGETNFRAVEKLFFLDACSIKGKKYEHLGDALANVWSRSRGAAGYFCLTWSPSGNVARDSQLGSTFCHVVTTKLLEPITLADMVHQSRSFLEEEARKKQQSCINPHYEDRLGARSERTLLKLSKDPVEPIVPPLPNPTDVLKGEIRKHEKYQKILRNKVARHADHLRALSNNLGVDSGRFIANHPHNMEDAAAELLTHWANGNEGETPIWSDLLKAMRDSQMTREADELKEYLRGGSA